MARVLRDKGHNRLTGVTHGLLGGGSRLARLPFGVSVGRPKFHDDVSGFDRTEIES